MQITHLLHRRAGLVRYPSLLGQSDLPSVLFFPRGWSTVVCGSRFFAMALRLGFCGYLLFDRRLSFCFRSFGPLRYFSAFSWLFWWLFMFAEVPK